MDHKNNFKRVFPVSMSADMIRSLKLAAVRNDQSAAALIRDLVAAYLKDRAAKA